MPSSANRFVALLSLLNLVNYVDRYVLASVLPRVKADLALTDADCGWLQTAFLIGYLLASPMFSVLARSVPRRTIIGWGMGVLGVATVASGYATNFWSLLALRAVVGVGEASYAALAPTFIDELVKPASRGKALASFYVMAPVGAAIGFIVGSQVERHLGWRTSFYFTGIPAIALAISALTLPETGRPETTSRSTFDDFSTLLREPVYRLNALAYTAFTFTIGGFSYWVPTYVSRQFGLSLAKASSTFGGILVVGGLLGSVVGGILYDRFQKASKAPRPDLSVGLAICGFSTLAATPLVAIMFMIENAGAFFALALPALVLLFTSNAPVNAVILRAAPPGLRLQSMGVTISVIHLFGDLWSPPLVGIISDVTGSLRAGCLIFPGALLLAAILWCQALRLGPRLNAESGPLK